MKKMHSLAGRSRSACRRLFKKFQMQGSRSMGPARRVGRPSVREDKLVPAIAGIQSNTEAYFLYVE